MLPFVPIQWVIDLPIYNASLACALNVIEYRVSTGMCGVLSGI